MFFADQQLSRRRWHNMPNIKSAIKRNELAKVRNARNKAARSELRTNLKKFDAAVAEGNREAAATTYKVAVKAVDRAVTKGLIHKNNAAHKKSGMAQKMNAM
jgi:small subunit ribosomal protein S20